MVIICLSFLSKPVLAEALCEQFDLEPTHFKSLYQQARKLGKEICLSYGETINSFDLAKQYAVFANQAGKQAARAFADKSFIEDIMIQMQHFVDVAQQGVNKETLPTLMVKRSGSFTSKEVAFYFSDWGDEEGESGSFKTTDAECNLQGQPTCKALLDDLSTAIEQYKKPYVHLSGKKLSERTSVLRSEWDHYLETARSHTLLDATFTTFMEKEYLAQDRLVGPMQKQWFLIHPSIVVENVSDASDGDEISEALAIEWIGVNWWHEDSSPIGYPIGVSLTSVFSDRASVDDIGHGLMFHFDNSMSVGWSDHDGSDSIYVTVDFLNLLAEKKGRWGDYRKSVEDIANR
jgi:hypothetical protein